MTYNCNGLDVFYTKPTLVLKETADLMCSMKQPWLSFSQYPVLKYQNPVGQIQVGSQQDIAVSLIAQRATEVGFCQAPRGDIRIFILNNYDVSQKK